MLCRYADALGRPGEGAHAPRLLGLAVVDVLLTIILAACVAHLMHFSFPFTLLCCFAAGIAAHRLFCVRTTVDKALFG